ncbi:MAG TPA: hypothetical protein DCX65_01700 [Spirochaetaceae bacterium]|nr:hypothetical protein [Spirochaetaceae bacterium]HAW85003.1 hypothetical protein [Spirochaetaceae bacterium]HAX36951.1 hypothetical protein [Spirochaetaceae bacterium]HCQ86647.1 hypothetical protein [Spirochaetaceae bacterium]
MVRKLVDLPDTFPSSYTTGGIYLSQVHTQEKQYGLVHKNIKYDLEIDSSRSGANEAAREILEYIGRNKPKWRIDSAFRQKA